MCVSRESKMSKMFWGESFVLKLFSRSFLGFRCLKQKKKVALVLFRERDQRALNNNRARSFYIHLFFKKSPETKNPRNKGRETLASVCVRDSKTGIS